VAGKVAVQEMPALAVAFLRTGLAGIAALPLALALRLPLPLSRVVRVVRHGHR
jgi:hypothetical protein